MVPYEGSTEGFTMRIRRNNLVIKAEVFFPRVLALVFIEGWLSQQPIRVSKAVRTREESA